MKNGILCVGALCALAGAAQAANVTFYLTTEFSSSGAIPSGPSPFGSASFDDAGANTVTLTLTRSTTIAVGEFFSKWFINLNPTMTPGSLSIVQGSGPVSTNSLRTGSDTESGFRGDGGSYFDVKFDWPTSSSSADRFDETWVSAVYTLSMAGLDATDFNDLGVGGGNSPNGLYHAVHVQGINGNSAWMTGGPGGPGPLVPLPPAAWAGMAGLGLVGLAGWKRRRSAR